MFLVYDARETGMSHLAPDSKGGGGGGLPYEIDGDARRLA